MSGRTAQPHQLVHADAEIVRHVLQIRLDQRAIEYIVTRRHRRMGGKHGGAGHLFQRGGQRHSPGNVFAAAFQDQKGGMTFVDVPDRRRDAQCMQGTHAANAQHDLLAQPGDAVAAIKLIGDGAVFVVIARHVGIEQIELEMSHHRLPDANRNVAAREAELDFYRPAIGSERWGDREIFQSMGMKLGALFGMFIDDLGEIALVVHQPDGHERQSEIARGLAIVARQDAEPAGIDGQAFVQAEFGAEIGDDIVGRIQMARQFRVQAACLVLVVPRNGQGVFVLLHEIDVIEQLLQTALGDLPQKHLGIVAAAVPQDGIHVPEDAPHTPIPSVQQVVGEDVEIGQPCRQAGLDFD